MNGMRPDLDLNPATSGFVVAISLIGCAIGAWFAGPLVARFPRTRMMFLAGILITLGSLGVAFSNHYLVVGLFRILTGLGIGLLSAVVPPYVAEISPPSIRGQLGSLWQLAIIVGTFLGLLVTALMARAAGGADADLLWNGSAWRWMYIVIAVVAAAYVLIAHRLPDSPPELISQGKEDNARSLLEKLGGGVVDEQVKAIRENQEGQTELARFSDLKGGTLGLQGLVWVGILLAVFQQVMGINVINNYSTTLWQLVGLSAASSFAVSLITSVINVVATIVAVIVIDKLGRRTWLISGAATMGVSLAVVAFFFSTATGSGDEVSLGRTEGIIALVAVNIYVIAFAVTWGPVMWVMLGEMFPSSIRTSAMAVSVAANWLANWAVTRTFPLLSEVGLGFTYGLYALFAFVGLAVVIKAVPETRGNAMT